MLHVLAPDGVSPFVPIAGLLPAVCETSKHEPLPANLLISPYPYFGGKSKIADEIWKRLGDVPNFVDPFFGSGSVLLKRPTDHPFRKRIETVNDKDGMVANFWRATAAEPDVVAGYADWPVNENDLHARHYWLVQQKDSLAAKLEGDPDFYDAKIAGWWVWGMALWIGSGFCSGDGSWIVVDGELVKAANDDGGVARQRPHLGNTGTGVNATRFERSGVAGQLPIMNTGRGVARKSMAEAGAVPRQMPRVSGAQGIARQALHTGDGGRRVHRLTIQRQRQELGHRGHSILAARAHDLYGYFDVLAERLRRVRVCSGDWTRVLGDSPTTKLGITGVVLDPPYTHDGRNTTLYNNDHPDIAAAVRAWAIANGNNSLLRIAYCGYEDDFAWPEGWTSLKWTPGGGFGSQRKHGENNNRHREIIWFSPHCLKVEAPRQIALEFALW